jgi:hypothetical protein
MAKQYWVEFDEDFDLDEVSENIYFDECPVCYKRHSEINMRHTTVVNLWEDEIAFKCLHCSSEFTILYSSEVENTWMIEIVDDKNPSDKKRERLNKLSTNDQFIHFLVGE